MMTSMEESQDNNLSPLLSELGPNILANPRAGAGPNTRFRTASSLSSSNVGMGNRRLNFIWGVVAFTVLVTLLAYFFYAAEIALGSRHQTLRSFYTPLSPTVDGVVSDDEYPSAFTFKSSTDWISEFAAARNETELSLNKGYITHDDEAL